MLFQIVVPSFSYSAVRRLKLLSLIFSEILIPPAVWQEVVESGAGRPAEIEVRRANWIRTVPVDLNPTAEASLSRIDRGEREAIALAVQLGPGHTLLMDDRAGRSYAESEGLQVVGSAGLLVHLKRRGLIQAVRPILDELQAAGLYLSDDLYRQLLTTVDEAPIC